MEAVLECVFDGCIFAFSPFCFCFELLCIFVAVQLNFCYLCKDLLETRRICKVRGWSAREETSEKYRNGKKRKEERWSA